MKISLQLGICALIALQGCSIQTSSSAWTTTDAWYRPAPANLAHEKSRLLADREVVEIVASKFPLAESMLDKKAIVPLSMGQFRNFAGKHAGVVPGKLPYLTRAIYLNEETGRFLVYESKTSLQVEHGTLGRGAVPMKRKALIVFLAGRPPANVFVNCSMAS